MDIGFGALIEKFEEYVGKRATRLLIYVIFVAVFGFSTRAIVENLVSPLLVFFRTPLWGATLVQLALMALSVGLGIALGAQVLVAFRRWKGLRKTEELLNRTQGLYAEFFVDSDGNEGWVRKSIQRLEKASEQNKALLRAIMDVGQGILEREAATDEDRARIQAVFADLNQDLDSETTHDHNVEKGLR